MKRRLGLRKRWLAELLVAAGFYINPWSEALSQESATPPAEAKRNPVDKDRQRGLPSSSNLPGPIVDPNLRQVQAPDVTPFQPPPVQPPPVQPAPTGPSGGQLGTTGFASTEAIQGLEAGRAAAVQTPGGFLVPNTEALTRGATDVGDLLGKSASSTGVETVKRSPIANESRPRGYHIGQVVTQADGAYWFPARQDLDTFFSKIDSGVVKDVIVVKGPYSARYGPGFAFIDIETLGSPRSEDGGAFMKGRTLFTYRTNGEGLYGRQSFWGGSDWWGFRVSYGQREADNYETGAGIEMPSTYNSRDIDFVYGMNLTPHSRIEFGYLRLDQTNVEYPGQIFNSEFLVTNGYRLRYVLEDQSYFDRLTIDGFYNRTSLAGNAQQAATRALIPQLDLLNFIGFTDADQASTGYRIAVTWGKAGDVQLTAGNDFRYVTGALNEFDNLFSSSIAGLPLPCGNVFNFPIPRSHQYVANGIFLENVTPVNDRLTVKAGGRVDWVGTDIDRVPPGFTCATFEDALKNNLGTTDVNPDYTLYMGYLTGDYKLNDTLSLTSGFGYAQRPPTLTELYALGPFLGILQQGFTTVLGNPTLASEKLYQIDLGVRASNEWFRGGANAFCSFVNDYITYQALDVGGFKLSSNLTGALTVQFVNTDLALLTGFEVYGETDLNEYLTPFVTVGYVGGRDLTRDSRGDIILGSNGLPIPGVGRLGAPQEPLPGISPMETRTGLRIHEASRNPRWGLELGARIVATQDRFAESLREERTGGFVIYDVRSYWQARKGVLLTAGVENLLDRNYREHLDLRTGFGVSQPGITGYMGFELQY